ncbi:MAG TPA: hypothetical protein VEF53_20690 [Patescibacteria group bacterium]|nr:hypothetical protein [Patescibacteria group bacterium]
MTKYSIKNICLGIGIGLVIASMANISAAPKSLSADEIKREAAKLGLIVMEPKDLIQKQPQESKEEHQQVNEPEQQTPAEQEPSRQEQTTVIVIKSGSSSESIAELLLSNKLIADKKVFLNRLTELKKESKLQIGTFKIPAGASVDKIIELITTLP